MSHIVSGWQRLILSVVVALAALALFDRLLLPLLLDSEASQELLSSDLYYWEWQLARLDQAADPALPSGSAGGGALAIGDSQLMSGLDPRLWYELLDEPLYLLALPSLQPEGIELLLADALFERVGAPSRLLLALNPYMLYESYVYESFRHYSRDRLLPRLSLTLLFNHPALAAERRSATELSQNLYRRSNIGQLSQRLYPLMQIPVERKEQQQPLGERISERRRQSRYIESQIEKSRGLWSWGEVVDESRLGECGQSIAADESAAAERSAARGWFSFRPRPAAFESYERLFTELEAADLEVTVLLLPFSPAWQSAAWSEELQGRFESDIEMLTARHQSIEIVTHFPDELGNNRYFRDWTHLNRCGAQRYSLFLIELFSHLQKSAKK